MLSTESWLADIIVGGTSPHAFQIYITGCKKLDAQKFKAWRIFFHCKEGELTIKDYWDRRKAAVAVWILLKLEIRKVVLKQ